MEKVIHWELCKISKFDYIKKCYMTNTESVLVNEMHQFLWNFEIHTDHLILARRPDVEIVKKNRDIAKLWALTSRKPQRKIDGRRKNWNRKVSVISVVIGVLDKVIKIMVNGLKELKIGTRVETIKKLALLRSERISNCFPNMKKNRKS